MALTLEEKGLIEESLSVYLQLASSQAPPQQVQQLASVARRIIAKLDNLSSGGGAGDNKPAGVSDEWFENVCKSCDMLEPDGCQDKVTMKFPGKCDPILHYERGKIMVCRM